MHTNHSANLGVAQLEVYEGDGEAERLQGPRLTSSGTSSFPHPEMKTPVRRSESPSGHLHVLWLRVLGHDPQRQASSMQVTHVAG